MIGFEGVRKTFATPGGQPVVAVERLDLSVGSGETHCLIGTSGCGKTTTLRLVNRLEQPDEGVVRLGGVDVSTLEPHVLRRHIGYVIQSGGLFPHMTVARNVGLLCELEGWTAGRTAERVQELLELVNLPPDAYAARHPDELSGGERQRVGVARALALDPDYVLMDEPFGALDPITREQLQQEFRSLESRVAKTVLLVTHDLHEAFLLGDRVTLMHDGRALQTGTPDDLRRRPVDAFVEQFVSGQVAAAAR